MTGINYNKTVSSVGLLTSHSQTYGWSYSNIPNGAFTKINASSITITTNATDFVYISWKASGIMTSAYNEISVRLYMDGSWVSDSQECHISNGSAVGITGYTGMSGLFSHVPGVGSHEYAIYVQSYSATEDLVAGIMNIFVYSQ